MNKHGKRFSKLADKINKETLYTAEEAIKLAKETSEVKFDASVEVHIRLGIDPKKGDQQVRGTLSLPHGTGKTKRVAAFVDSSKEAEAKKAGADVIFSADDEINKLAKSGKIDFDIAVAMPLMMPKVAKLAKLLGPRGLMPNPKTDTVGDNIEKMVSDQKAGKLAYKNDDTSNIHQIIGKVSFDEKQLLENYETFFEAITKAKPAGSKGIYIKGISISTSMGPGIKVTV